MGMGVIMGGINGLIVAYGRVPAIITTLATLAIYRSVLITVANAQTIETRGLPDWIVNFPGTTLFEFGKFDIRLIFAHRPHRGRRRPAAAHLPALRPAALCHRLQPRCGRMVGLPMQRDVFLAYLGCGALAGLGGLMQMAKFGTITVDSARGLEMAVIAAVVVGGANIFGGSGSAIGVMLGAVLIAVLDHVAGPLDRHQRLHARLPAGPAHPAGRGRRRGHQQAPAEGLAASPTARRERQSRVRPGCTGGGRRWIAPRP